MKTAPRSKSRARAGIVDVVIVGAGHAGLAMSHRLRDMSIDHVVLERGEVGNSWRRERWDSLTLLTPNWMTRLPGKDYAGNDPDGYMDTAAIVDFLSAYADESASPVRTGTTVLGVAHCDNAYRVDTDRGTWRCRAVVLASGTCNEASVPACAQAVPGSVFQITSKDYKRPAQLPAGGVLVVGASATGLQLAQEIHASGRPVTLAVGEHVRMPRRYRDRDVQWWMLAAGILDQCIDEVDDPVRVRRLPSPQLVGTRDHSDLDLNALTLSGVQLVGRLAGIRDGKAQFSGSLRNVCALADLKMRRLLNTLDDFAAQIGLDGASAAGEIEPTRIGDRVRLGLDFRSSGIRTIVWATGYRPDYSWLNVPVLDRKGQLVHDGGVVASPGLYALGLPFMRRRKSSFIHGAEADVRDLAGHLAAFLGKKKVSDTVFGRDTREWQAATTKMVPDTFS
ncbi:MAG TPA: NAD(P)-binding domain-containing protein [Woeseiaceae bacterium]|nr:NAD(P)-binding domain-containing protein [Woeseiaceae bacterium]